MSDPLARPQASLEKPRLVVGISGASGVIYGLRTLDACRELGVESHLVLSKSAALTLLQETGFSVAEVNEKAVLGCLNGNGDLDLLSVAGRCDIARSSAHLA